MITEKGNSLLNFVLIGCGRISATYLQAIASVPECRLKGVCDVRNEAAQNVARHYGCRAYTEYPEVLRGNRIDAVVICTPPNTHTEIATFFLEHGIHVLCEKPLALTSKEAGLMVRKADEKGCLLMMASKFRYVDDIFKAKGIVDSGILGEVVLFENIFCSKVDMKNRWNSKKEVSGGGVLIDNGSHSVDIARFLLGPIVKIQAEEGKRIQEIEVEDTVRLYFRTQSDTMGAVDLSWSIHKERDSYIDLFGTEGVLSIGWKCSKYRQSEKLDWVSFGSGYDKFSAFTRQIKNFVACISGIEPPMINGMDSIESVRVIEAAYKSLWMNKWVQIESTLVPGNEQSAGHSIPTGRSLLMMKKF